MVPTFSVLPHECVAKGWDHGVRLGTPLFLNNFSCRQPPREVGTGLGPRGRLGHSAGAGEPSGSLFSYGDLEVRIPAWQPLRKIWQVVNEALASLEAELHAAYSDFGRP